MAKICSQLFPPSRRRPGIAFSPAIPSSLDHTIGLSYLESQDDTDHRLTSRRPLKALKSGAVFRFHDRKSLLSQTPSCFVVQRMLPRSRHQSRLHHANLFLAKSHSDLGVPATLESVGTSGWLHGRSAFRRQDHGLRFQRAPDATLDSRTDQRLAYWRKLRLDVSWSTRCRYAEVGPPVCAHQKWEKTPNQLVMGPKLICFQQLRRTANHPLVLDD